jgi:hypothetical protein
MSMHIFKAAFSGERARIDARIHATWGRIHAEKIPSLESQIVQVFSGSKEDRIKFIQNLFSENSEAHKEMVSVDANIDAFNELVSQNKVSNFRIPVDNKLLSRYKAALNKAFIDVEPVAESCFANSRLPFNRRCPHAIKKC